MASPLRPFSWDRMIRAVERVRDRLVRATSALEGAGVPHCVVGGHAVAAWVSRVDEAAVRNTQDVDILIRREDFDAARDALTAAGFHYRRAAGVDVFLDAPGGSARDAVHVLIANERVRNEHAIAAPDVTESEPADGCRVVSLPALVAMMLTAFRDKDRTHLRDLIDVGHVDASWLPRVPPALADRLRDVLDHPDG